MPVGFGTQVLDNPDQLFIITRDERPAPVQAWLAWDSCVRPIGTRIGFFQRLLLT